VFGLLESAQIAQTTGGPEVNTIRPALELRAISKSFAPIRANRGVYPAKNCGLSTGVNHLALTAP